MPTILAQHVRQPGLAQVVTDSDEAERGQHPRGDRGVDTTIPAGYGAPADTSHDQAVARQQLRQLFADYRTAFPDWAVEHDVVLTRSKGPVTQRIAVEALRSGAYRPSCSIAVNAGTGPQVLFRLLDIKHREVLPREHPSKRPAS